MKKMLFKVIAFILIATMTCGVAVLATAEVPVYFDVINGQKVMFGDIGDVVSYLSSLDRQQMIDMAIIDRGYGEFYARVLSDQTIAKWSTGEQIHAYDLTEDLSEYYMLQNYYMLVQDENGQVEVNEAYPEGYLDNIDYPKQVYSEKDMALIEEYILSESYPNSEGCYDTLDVEKGFNNQEMFRALVLAYFWSEKHNDWAYVVAWKVVKEDRKVAVAPAKNGGSKKRSKNTRKPTVTPAPTSPAHSTPRPTDAPAHSTPRPTATPRVSDEKDEFEHSTRRPSDTPTKAPDHSKEDEDWTASHSTAKPSNDEGVIERDPQDKEEYTSSHSHARPSSDKDVINRDPADKPAHSSSSSGSSSSHSSHKDDVFVRDSGDSHGGSSSAHSDSGSSSSSSSSSHSNSGSSDSGSSSAHSDTSSSSAHSDTSSSSAHSDTSSSSGSESHSQSSNSGGSGGESSAPSVSSEYSDFE